ncbi:MAG: 30S ribosomal protein S5 [Candidatus Bathyarchaeota archaeon]|jgi:small subunit ribosomal protein S5|nr:30S ribosomal protein S5 [Candidatus Bathyarchaeota archaeon]MCW3992762.1 30S ribosomal protein S5 [Candidatus Bathyarchaeota archaeon]
MSDRRRRSREDALESWVPKTRLGRMVREGQISSIYEIFEEGYKIKEVEIIDVLVPDLRDDVIDINLVQKQTDAGERSRFRAIVAIGNGDGLIGLGAGKAPRVRNAIEKGITDAKMNLYPIRRGCGSWECDCGEPHTLPFKVQGKSGSVVVTLIPGAKGLGLVAGDVAKRVLTLAGVKDCWSKAIGATQTTTSFSFATFEALKNTVKMMTPKDWSA